MGQPYHNGHYHFYIISRKKFKNKRNILGEKEKATVSPYKIFDRNDFILGRFFLLGESVTDLSILLNEIT